MSFVWPVLPAPRSRLKCFFYGPISECASTHFDEDGDGGNGEPPGDAAHTLTESDRGSRMRRRCNDDTD